MVRLNENDPVDPNADAASGATVTDPAVVADPPAVVAGDPPADPPVDPNAPTDPPTEKLKDGRDKRIAKLTAQLTQARKALEERAAGRTGDYKDLTPEEFNARVEAAAEEKRAADEFARQTNAAAEDGKKEFGESQFKERIDSLVTLIDPADAESRQRYVRFIQTALETGAAHRVCYALGEDLDRAEEIMNMSPAKQAIALDRLANSTAKPATQAGRPIAPVGAKGPAHTQVPPDDKERADNLSTAEWMKRREAQVAAARGRR